MATPTPQENPFIVLARRYMHDPVAFVTEVVGIRPDPWQEELTA